MTIFLTSRRRARLLAGLIVAVALGALSVLAVPVAADSLPASLTDREFWKVITDFSEPDGFFRSDNLLSNEMGYQQVIPELLSRTKAGRVYMGVGPEQNFTYIAATKPAMVFIIDIRRGNLDLQMMYKALFELSADRADFVSQLFARKRPADLTTASSADEIFAAVQNADKTEELFNENLKIIQDHLTLKHGFELSPEDLKGIEYVYRAFFKFGPQIQYSSSGSFGGSFQPSYAELMVATDGAGENRGFLANEESFRVLKELHRKNLLVPVVGNFAGPKALRAVGNYIRQKGGTVSAFYLSNVEQYLQMDGIWGAFCASVATLPLDETSTFIRSVRRANTSPNTGLASELGQMMAEVKECPAPR
jgi:hypothetical protein